ncbi:MAG: Imm32 family immunity protein [Candidatus Edwardsbacteria bacterium]|jgi:hypothetical protein|nr:Imm32 family immunity protein [Candidatus Edwardsbacteria bacterium]
MVLSVEALRGDKGSELSEIAITFDAEGLDVLLTSLNRLKQKKGHDHLMTPSWAGNELTETRHGGANSLLINHLRLVRIE